jgi:predicted Zn-dependent protease
MKKLQFTVLVGLLMTLGACVEPEAPKDPPKQSTSVSNKTLGTAATAPQGSVKPTGRLASVIRKVEPIGEKICLQSGVVAKCNFTMVVDPSETKIMNAYQSMDNAGRPLIVITKALADKARNSHELALVVGHEMAHHIEGHLEKRRSSAIAGALIFGLIAGAAGAGETGLDVAMDIGGTVGARAYSKNHELEADYLGARIAEMAGYDAKVGVKFFTQIPDPGQKFLGTHPAHKDRVKIVNDVAKKY